MKSENYHEHAKPKTDVSSTSSVKEKEQLRNSLSHAEYGELLTKLNETEEKLNNAQAMIEDYKNQLLRNQAELDNVRKRAEKDIQNFYKYGLEKFIIELLPVIDSLERGIAIEVGENEFAKQVHAGLEMTLKLLLDVFGKSGISPVDPVGQTFDPAFHQAVAMQDSEVQTNTILQVLQKGYVLNERLIRPASVVVAK